MLGAAFPGLEPRPPPLVEFELELVHLAMGFEDSPIHLPIHLEH